MRANEFTESKMNYGKRYRGTGIQNMRTAPDISFGPHQKPKKNGNTANSAVQALQTRARNAPEELNIQAHMPDKASKGEIRQYLRQDPEYAELDDMCSAILRQGHARGLSKIQMARADRRVYLLKKLPFGPIKTIEPVKKKEKYDPMAFLKK